MEHTASDLTEFLKDYFSHSFHHPIIITSASKIFLSFARFAAHNFYNRNHSIKKVSFFSFLNFKLSSIKNDPTICMILHFIVCTAYSETIKATFIGNIDTWFYNRKMPQMSQNSLFFIIFFTYGMCLAPNFTYISTTLSYISFIHMNIYILASNHNLRHIVIGYKNITISCFVKKQT